MRPLKIILVLACAALAGLGGTVLVRHPELLPWSDDAGAPPGALELFGNVEVRDVSLAFSRAEHVKRVLVEEGDHVEAGDLIATLVTDRLEARLAEARARVATQQEVLRRLANGSRPEEIAQARARLRAARAHRDHATREAERLAKTASTGATTEQALDDARSRVAVASAEAEALAESVRLAERGPREEDVAGARARLAELEAAVAVLGVELEDTRLRAPCAGVVQSRVLEPGEYATPERPVVTLALIDRKWVRAWLPEPEMGRVALGMSASVTGDSYPGRRFEGRVGFISPIAEFTPKTVETTELRTQLVFEVRIHVRDPEDRLRLGQPVTVRIDPRGGEPEGR